MTSYFEKLTSINTASLKFQASSSQSSADLTSALEKIDELKKQNNKLELDLKCEHDEKTELVTLKVGLESEILELREVNDRLEFQVEQLKDEKDNIHQVLAKIKEDQDDRNNKGLFIAGSGVMKKFPSLDDLFLPSSPTDSNRATCVTPTSTASGGGGPLERIEEIDETLLESLVLSTSNNNTQEHHPEKLLLPDNQKPTSSTFYSSSAQQQSMDQLLKRISFLEQENELLRRTTPRGCPKCRGGAGSSRDHHRGSGSSLFDHDDEGLVLSAIHDNQEYEEDNEEEVGDGGYSDYEGEDEEHQISAIVAMQRKIIDKLERQVFRLEEEVIVGGSGRRGSPQHDEHHAGNERAVRVNVNRLKNELQRKMGAIVKRAQQTQQQLSRGEGQHDQSEQPDNQSQVNISQNSTEEEQEEENSVVAKGDESRGDASQ